MYLLWVSEAEWGENLIFQFTKVTTCPCIVTNIVLCKVLGSWSQVIMWEFQLLRVSRFLCVMLFMAFIGALEPGCTFSSPLPWCNSTTSTPELAPALQPAPRLPVPAACTAGWHCQGEEERLLSQWQLSPHIISAFIPKHAPFNLERRLQEWRRHFHGKHISSGKTPLPQTQLCLNPEDTDKQLLAHTNSRYLSRWAEMQPLNIAHTGDFAGKG